MKYENIPWVSDSDYQKARGQFKGVLRDIMKVFNLYGMEIYVPGAIEEIADAADDYSLRLRGIDKPIKVKPRNARE